MAADTTTTKGRFVTFEGIEGSGKSTQARALVAALERNSIPALLTREPGGSDGAEMIRELLLNGPKNRWDPTTEALLFNAARRDHVMRKIKPALEQGIWVVCDRFVDSTFAYQGSGHGVSHDELAMLHYIAVDGFLPDLTIVLDLLVSESLARVAERKLPPDRFEQLDVIFHQNVRGGLLAAASADQERVALIYAGSNIADVTAAVITVVQSRLGVQLATK